MKLGVQIGIGLVLAGILVTTLQWCVMDEPAADAKARPAPRIEREAPPDLAAEGRGLLDSLQARVRHFHLATNPEALPAECRPVLRVRTGGAIVIAEPPARIDRPGEVVWERLGVLLPQARIADLSASERSSLVLIWSRLAGPGRLDPERIHVEGCQFAVGELDLLLRWLR